MTDPLNTTPYDEPGSQKAGRWRSVKRTWLWSSIRGTCRTVRAPCGNDHYISCHVGQRDEHPRDSNADSIGFRLSLSLQAG
jgi:hypothetical protein